MNFLKLIQLNLNPPKLQWRCCLMRPYFWIFNSELKKEKQFSLVSWTAAYIFVNYQKTIKTIFTVGTCSQRNIIFSPIFHCRAELTTNQQVSKTRNYVCLSHKTYLLFNLWKGFAVARPKQVFMCTQCTVFISIVRKGTLMFLAYFPHSEWILRLLLVLPPHGPTRLLDGDGGLQHPEEGGGDRGRASEPDPILVILLLL